MNTLKLSIITCFSILYSLTSFAEVKSDVSIEIGSFDSIDENLLSVGIVVGSLCFSIRSN